MTAYAPLLEQPATWGVLGAFIYAAPRWIACLIACRQAQRSAWLCSVELPVALSIGAIAAAAFSAVVVGLTNVQDGNAVSAMIGLLANPTAPVLVKRLSSLAGSTLASKLLPPPEEKP